MVQSARRAAPQGVKNRRPTAAEMQTRIEALETELAEARAQQTATADVLHVINASPGDLPPVFDAMLEKAHSLCGVTQGSLQLYDGKELRAVADRGVPEAYAALLRGGFRPPLGTIGGDASVQVDLAELAANAPADDVIVRAGIEIANLRTVLFVPLRKDGSFLGRIVAARQELRPFSDWEIALLENFADQAVIAMENARLITETREALAQQTATAEVLQVINASPGDLAPVFDAMLDKAMRLCEASFGTLSRIDGESFYAIAVHGAPAAFAEAMRQPHPITPGNAHHRLMLGEDVVQIEDVTADDAYRSGNPARRLLADVAGARTALWVALRRESEALGAFVVYRREMKPFTEKQIALLQNFAAQAVIAMENARLITETREALEQQTATAEVLQVINSSPGDLAPVFDAILEKAHALCGAAKGALVTCDGERFRAVATRGLSEAYAALLRAPQQNPPGSPPQRLLDGESLVQVSDMGALAFPIPRAAAELEGIRTVLYVPLRKDGTLLGFITAYRQEVRPFSDKQIALLQNFAAQAVIAMENARLITETREALDQQTATAEVLQVINASPGDLAPVFDAMLEKATGLCDAAFGFLDTYDGEFFHRIALRGATPEIAEFMTRTPHPVGPDNAHGRLLRGEPVVHIADITEDKAFLSGDPLRQALVELGGRTLLAVPLRKEGVLLGDFIIFRKEVRPFSDKQIALLQNFAAQAVIAMENARLITETREALEQQTATAEVLQVINSSPGDLAPVFDAILEKAHALCGAPCGSLQIFDGELFRAVATRGLPEAYATILRRGVRSSDVDPGAIVQFDFAERAAHSPDNQNARIAVEVAKLRTVMFVPLRKDDALIGRIAAGRQEARPFTEKQIALLENFAAQAVIAIENARLLGELRQRTEEVAELNRGLEARVAEQVDELGRVGRLKRFLAPQLAELIVSQGDEKILESHRREIVVVFCDLRGYTAFTETAEPEEVLDFLREYHGALGPLVSQFEGTLDQFSGDGIMVFFNDPVPIPDSAERAVNMAVAMREAAGTLIADWRERGRDLGFGAGIAQGYATLGQIGFSERSGYTAIGTVCNVAARLCAEAKDGQILLSQRVNVALKGSVATKQVGALALKGLAQPVIAYNVPLAATQPALRVIEGGPQSV